MVVYMKFYSIVLLALTLINFSSYAQIKDEEIMGYGEDTFFDDSDTLREKITEIASSVCQLRASKSESIFRFIDPRDKSDGNARFIDQEIETELDRFYCSAVVINDNTFITASHCNQVNIERTIKFGGLELPGAKYEKSADGKSYKLIRNKDCESGKNKNPKECKVLLAKVRYEQRLNDVYLTCFPGEKNEIRVKAPANRGWPNPRFSAARANYDTTVWRTIEKISPSVKRAPIMVEEKDLHYSFLKYGRSCKTLGYGPVEVGNKDAPPTFKILHTPVSSFNKEAVSTAMADYLRPGDSGGGFFCLGKDEKYYLAGINSRSYIYEGVSVFSLNSFNGDWIKYVLNDPNVPLEHEGSVYVGSPVIYHKAVVKFEIKNLEGRIALLNQCVKDIKKSGDKLGFGREIKSNYKLIKKKFDQIVKKFNSKKDEDVFIRSLVFEHYDKVEKVLDHCLSINPSSILMDRLQTDDFSGEF